MSKALRRRATQIDEDGPDTPEPLDTTVSGGSLDTLCHPRDPLGIQRCRMQTWQKSGRHIHLRRMGLWVPPTLHTSGWNALVRRNVWALQ